MYVDIDLLRPFILKERHSLLAEKIFVKKEKFSTSVITFIQLISDLFTAKKDVKVLDKLKKIKDLQVVPLDESIIKKAIEIVDKYKLPTHSAIHAATSLKLKEKFLSFDRALDNIPKIERTDPFLFVGEEENAPT